MTSWSSELYVLQSDLRWEGLSPPGDMGFLTARAPVPHLHLEPSCRNALGALWELAKHFSLLGRQ